ncbi:MAG: MobC family plasmid mobilization relaxosome protein [Faecalimonas sp.]|nr:MobC family plasmid mobilization relaxosome protein [Faecalimonas sp.]
MADKTTTVSFRMNEAERKLLHEKASEYDMTESMYLRFLITQKPNDYPEIRKLLRDTINEINHIGTNINQIVKNHNSSFYKKEDKVKLTAYMRRVDETLQKVVDAIGDH